jgi:hypothetical protein
MAIRGGRGGSPAAFGVGGSEGAGAAPKVLKDPLYLPGDSTPRHPDGPLYGQALPQDTTHEHWEGIKGGNYVPGQVRASREIGESTPGAPRRISKTRGVMAPVKEKPLHDGGQVASALVNHIGTVANWMGGQSINATEHPEAAEKFAQANDILTNGGSKGHLLHDAHQAVALRASQASYQGNKIAHQTARQLLKVHQLITSDVVRKATGSAPEPIQKGRSKKSGEAYLDIPTLARSAGKLPMEAAKTTPSKVLNMGRGRKVDLTNTDVLNKVTDFAEKIDQGKVDQANAETFDSAILGKLKPKRKPKTAKPLSTDTSAEADAARSRRESEQQEIDASSGDGREGINRTMAGIGAGAVPSGNSLAIKGRPGVGRLKKTIKADKPVGRGRTVKAADKVTAATVAAGKKAVADVAAKDNATIETVSGVSRVNQRTIAGGGRPDKENAEGTAARNKARTDELKQQSDKFDAANGVTKPERAPRKKRTGRLAKLRNLGK